MDQLKYVVSVEEYAERYYIKALKKKIAAKQYPEVKEMFKL